MLSVMDLIIALKRIPLFTSVHGEGLKRIAESIREKTISPGELVFAEHELGEEMYVVHSGKILIFHDTAGRENILDSVRAGGYFGEMAIIDEQPRSASARASEESVLLVLHKNDFRAAIHDYPEIAFEVLKEFVRRLRAADFRIRSLASELQKGQVETT
jgi:CRP/FNR family transcriptional regulator